MRVRKYFCKILSLIFLSLLFLLDVNSMERLAAPARKIKVSVDTLLTRMQTPTYKITNEDLEAFIEYINKPGAITVRNKGRVGTIFNRLIIADNLVSRDINILPTLRPIQNWITRNNLEKEVYFRNLLTTIDGQIRAREGVMSIASPLPTGPMRSAPPIRGRSPMTPASPEEQPGEEEIVGAQEGVVESHAALVPQAQPLSDVAPVAVAPRIRGEAPKLEAHAGMGEVGAIGKPHVLRGSRQPVPTQIPQPKVPARLVAAGLGTASPLPTTARADSPARSGVSKFPSLGIAPKFEELDEGEVEEIEEAQAGGSAAAAAFVPSASPAPLAPTALSGSASSAGSSSSSSALTVPAKQFEVLIYDESGQSKGIALKGTYDSKVLDAIIGSLNQIIKKSEEAYVLGYFTEEYLGRKQVFLSKLPILYITLINKKIDVNIEEFDKLMFIRFAIFPAKLSPKAMAELNLVSSMPSPSIRPRKISGLPSSLGLSPSSTSSSSSKQSGSKPKIVLKKFQIKDIDLSGKIIGDISLKKSDFSTTQLFSKIIELIKALINNYKKDYKTYKILITIVTGPNVGQDFEDLEIYNSVDGIKEIENKINFDSIDSFGVEFDFRDEDNPAMQPIAPLLLSGPSASTLTTVQSSSARSRAVIPKQLSSTKQDFLKHINELKEKLKILLENESVKGEQTIYATINELSDFLKYPLQFNEEKDYSSQLKLINLIFIPLDALLHQTNNFKDKIFLQRINSALKDLNENLKKLEEEGYIFLEEIDEGLLAAESEVLTAKVARFRPQATTVVSNPDRGRPIKRSSRKGKKRSAPPERPVK